MRTDIKQYRILGKLLFLIYISFLLYFLIFAEWYGRSGEMRDYHYNLVLFQEIQRFWIYREKLGWISFANLIGNVVIFIPFGFFMPWASRFRSFFLTLVYSFGFSLVVETFQFITKVGSFDVDDLLLNTIGGILGYILFVICNSIRRRQHAVRERKDARER